jgi:glycosyltransferase involved in cell wall biosynthesis
VLKRWLLFPVLRRCAAAMGLGSLQRDYFRSMGIPPFRIFTVPLTPHLERFALTPAQRAETRADLRRTQGIPEHAVVGLFVGRLVSVKALPVLLRSLSLLPPHRRPHLMIAGDGPERAALERTVAEQSLPVRFLGFCANEDLPDLMAAADFLVLPSLRDAWGVVVAEAMAAGLPVVLSDQVGAAYDLLEPGRNGFLVPAGSTDALRDALGHCVEMGAELADMGQRSRARIAGWNCETAAQEFYRAVAVALQGEGGRVQ